MMLNKWNSWITFVFSLKHHEDAEYPTFCVKTALLFAMFLDKNLLLKHCYIRGSVLSVQICELAKSTSTSLLASDIGLTKIDCQYFNR